MNYYVRTQQALAAHAAQSAARMAYMHGLRGLGQSTAGLPAGSRLTYNVSFVAPVQSGPGAQPTMPLASIVQQITTALSAGYGVNVISQTLGAESIFSDNRSLALTVGTLSDRNSQNDVKSIIDGLLQNLGATNINSSIGVLTVGTTAPGTPPPPQPPSTDFGQWMSDNWPWVVAAGLGLVVVSEVL